MPNYSRIIKNLEPKELNKYVILILEYLRFEELKGYAASDEAAKGLSEEQLRKQIGDDLGLPDKKTGKRSLRSEVAVQRQKKFLQEQEDVFAEEWEQQHDTGDWMHPDEDDEEFFEHEAPDKD